MFREQTFRHPCLKFPRVCLCIAFVHDHFQSAASCLLILLVIRIAESSCLFLLLSACFYGCTAPIEYWSGQGYLRNLGCIIWTECFFLLNCFNYWYETVFRGLCNSHSKFTVFFLYFLCKDSTVPYLYNFYKINFYLLFFKFSEQKLHSYLFGYELCRLFLKYEQLAAPSPFKP